jgi:hypothetical protein
MALWTKLLPLVLLAACKDGGGGEDTGDPCDPALYNYETVGSPYLSSWCVSCHTSVLSGERSRAGAPEGVDFNTYLDFLQQIDKIPNYALGEEPLMPPAGGPSSESYALFSHWVECGAQE